MFSACWRLTIPLIYMYFTIWMSDTSSECGVPMSWCGAALWQKQLSLAELFNTAWLKDKSLPITSTGDSFGPAGRMGLGSNLCEHCVCSAWLRLHSTSSLHMYNSSPVSTSCDRLGNYLQRIIFYWEMMIYFDPSVRLDMLPNEESGLVKNINKRPGPRPNTGIYLRHFN